MTTIPRKTARTLFVATCAAVLTFGTACAQADDFSLRINIGQDIIAPPPAYDRVWVEPVYEVRVERVWVEPVTENRCDWVFVQPVTERRTITYRDECGVIRSRVETVVVNPGGWQMVTTPVVVRDGYWNNVEQQVCVREGYWQEVPRPVVYSDVRLGAHWELRDDHPRGYRDDDDDDDDDRYDRRSRTIVRHAPKGFDRPRVTNTGEHLARSDHFDGRDRERLDRAQEQARYDREIINRLERRPLPLDRRPILNDRDDDRRERSADRGSDRNSDRGNRYR